jgi:hypothetical protein
MNPTNKMYPTKVGGFSNVHKELIKKLTVTANRNATVLPRNMGILAKRTHPAKTAA